ncbi:MAG: recombinase family protein [Bacteroidales bacterium]|jgi:DNA invertase Pin-like site-specific DNA recombinase
MKVAIYVRVSTEEQDYENQIELCKKHCEVRGWEIYKIYQDVFTGTSSSRPSFNELLEDMRHYRFNAIVVTKLDRIGRSLKHLLSLFDELNVKGVQFVAVTQNIDTTTSAGKLQMQIMGAFAEFERNLISERTKEGLKGKVNVGKRGKDKHKRKNRVVLRTPLYTKIRSKN